MTQAPWQIVKNDLGIEVLVVGQGTRREDIPAEFGRVLGDAYWEALDRPRAYFEDMARRCRLGGLKRLLEAMAAFGFCRIYAARSNMGGAGDSMAYLQGRVPHHRLALRLAESSPHVGVAKLLPESLAMVYEVLDGTIERGPYEAGGMHSHDMLFHDMRDLAPFAGVVPVDTASVLSFYTSDCGDQIVSHDNLAWWYRHESNNFALIGEIEPLLDRYFDAYVTGRMSPLPDPYGNGG